MDHPSRGVDRAFAADENDAPPVPLPHAGQIRTAQAHAAEHVYLEEPPPLLIGNILKGFGSNMPRLFTRMSTSGNRWSSVFVAAAVERSPAKLSILASGTACSICPFASATAFSERPFTMTRAPSWASPVAMANPM